MYHNSRFPDLNNLCRNRFFVFWPVILLVLITLRMITVRYSNAFPWYFTIQSRFPHFPSLFFVPRLSFYPLISLVRFPCGKLDAKSAKFIGNWLTKISVIIRKTEMSVKLKVEIRVDRTFFTYIFSVSFSAVFLCLLFFVGSRYTNQPRVSHGQNSATTIWSILRFIACVYFLCCKFVNISSQTNRTDQASLQNQCFHNCHVDLVQPLNIIYSFNCTFHSLFTWILRHICRSF